MKKLLMGAAAAAAIAAPGIASADTNAVVGVQYNNVDYGSGSSDADIYGLNGGFSHDLMSGVLQVDGASSRVDVSGCCINLGYAAVHYGMRNDSYSFAGNIGTQNFFGFSGLAVGLEGQWFLSNVTFDGSLSYADFSDVDFEATHVQIDGTYFATPNLGFQGILGYTDTDSSGVDWTTYGVGMEWRFDNSPTSLTLGYRNADADGFDSDVWSIGLNFDLGTGSVQERMNSGPGWNGASAFSASLASITP